MDLRTVSHDDLKEWIENNCKLMPKTEQQLMNKSWDTKTYQFGEFSFLVAKNINEFYASKEQAHIEVKLINKKFTYQSVDIGIIFKNDDIGMGVLNEELFAKVELSIKSHEITKQADFLREQLSSNEPTKTKKIKV